MLKVKFVPIVLSLSALILAFTVFYYFVIYLPKIENLKLEAQQDQEKTKLILEQQFKEEVKQDYEVCLAKAEQDFSEKWLARCQANNIPIFLKSNGISSCTLLDTMSEVIRQDYEKEKDRCLEVLKQF